MLSTVAYVLLAVLLLLVALVLGLLFAPVDPRSRKSGGGVIRGRWHVPQAIFVDPVHGMGGVVHIVPESWMVTVEIEGALVETSVRREFFDAVKPGVHVRVVYSRTRFTRWLRLEEMRT